MRVATVSDALVEEIMLVFGVEDRLVGIGSTCLIREFEYEYTASDGRTFSHVGGMNPARFLYEDLVDLPLFVRPGTEINFERLAGLQPDVLIVDTGCCTVPWRRDREAMTQGLQRLESLGIPTVVLKGPNSGGDLSIGSLSAAIQILGEVFQRQDKAEWLADYLESAVYSIVERTRSIAESERVNLLLLGLNPDLRKHGAVGHAYGTHDIQAYFVEELARARNAFRGKSQAILNLEQILALEPDVVVLPTANGYHPPRELYELKYFKNLQYLKAVKNRRVAALPWSPCNCDKRLEYPIDVMVIAKAAYPERFSDIRLSDWLLRFYRDVYSVDEETALGVLHAQWMDWTLQGGQEVR
jgi:iron complex transport system substrate-binding protein